MAGMSERWGQRSAQERRLAEAAQHAITENLGKSNETIGRAAQRAVDAEYERMLIERGQRPGSDIRLRDWMFYLVLSALLVCALLIAVIGALL
jgi:hypothetical protein